MVDVKLPKYEPDLPDEILDSIDLRILKYKMRFPKLNVRQLGELVGLSASEVRSRLHTRRMRIAAKYINAKHLEALRDYEKIAAMRLEQLIESDDAATALRALRLYYHVLLEREKLDLVRGPRLIDATVIDVDRDDRSALPDKTRAVAEAYHQLYREYEQTSSGSVEGDGQNSSA